MTHGKNTFLEKRIPRAFGIVVLLLSMGTIFYLSRNAVIFGTRAAADKTPKDVQISNITDTSFTVSYVTDESLVASISFGKDPKLGQVAFDTRDGSTPTPHNTHYITVPNLTPSTKYFYSITSGDQTFLNNNAPYEITTAPVSPAGGSSSANTKSNQAPLTGKVSLEDGTAPPEAIAYAQTDNPASPAGGSATSSASQTLSSLVKPDGSFTMPLNTLLKKDLSGSLPLTPQTILKMSLVSPTLLSKVSLLASQTNPVPPIILSKDYDFSIDDQPLAKDTVASSSADFPVSEDTTIPSTVQILTPKTDEEFKDQMPLFEGKAQPNTDVEITINSSHEIKAVVQTDENGSWEYRPNTPLEPGEHTITVNAFNAEGIITSISKQFTVFAEGSQFTEPSIEPTRAPTPTIFIPQPTAVPTATPTSTPSATPTVIASASPTLAPTISVAQTSPVPNITTPPIPKSGSASLIFGLIGLSSLIGIGSLLFFLL